MEQFEEHGFGICPIITLEHALRVASLVAAPSDPVHLILDDKPKFKGLTRKHFGSRFQLGFGSQGDSSRSGPQP
jgi:hypothetical protein